MNWGGAPGRQLQRLNMRHHCGRGGVRVGQNVLCMLRGGFYGSLEPGTLVNLPPPDYHLHSWDTSELRTNPSDWRACTWGRGQCLAGPCWGSGRGAVKLS